MDFVYKITIAQKKVNEIFYQIELLHKSDYITENLYIDVVYSLVEIRKILTAIIATSRRN
jgi:four helix bundle protein